MQKNYMHKRDWNTSSNSINHSTLNLTQLQESLNKQEINNVQFQQQQQNKGKSIYQSTFG